MASNRLLGVNVQFLLASRQCFHLCESGKANVFMGTEGKQAKETQYCLCSGTFPLVWALAENST